MLIAASTTKEGRNLLIIGLQERNVSLLMADQPIYKNLGTEGVPGLEDWDITILGSEDTARFVAHFGGEK
jgi:hypothetical protein